ncbi:hypothetical protein LTR94_028153, partial [Friedmanniomyces endolithicus]
MDLEGVISKRLDAPYDAGRSSTWVKSKCRGRDEVVVGGWASDGEGRFKSLLVGVNEKAGLRYLGRVGTGYSAPVLKPLLAALKSRKAEVSPFSPKGSPKSGRNIHWISADLVVELEHGGFTESGALRQASYKGLRQDKTAEEVTDGPQPPRPDAKIAQGDESAKPKRSNEGAVGSRKVIVAGITLSNPDKVLWPASAGMQEVRKADFARYYEDAEERILEHVARRPMSIIRAPDGIGGQSFFQRHAMAGSNPRLIIIDVGDAKPYIGVEDAAGLVAIAQSGGLELHPWGCRPDDPEAPDQVTFDLDPDEGLDFSD